MEKLKLIPMQCFAESSLMKLSTVLLREKCFQNRRCAQRVIWILQLLESQFLRHQQPKFRAAPDGMLWIEQVLPICLLHSKIKNHQSEIYSVVEKQRTVELVRLIDD